MWRYAIPALVLFVLGGFFARGLFLNPSAVESPLIGKPAPQFSLPDLQDPAQEVGTADFFGDYALLNVWATWCVECRHEHDFLLQLSRGDVPIYGLNWKDERDKALSWLQVLGDPYQASAEDQIGDVAIDYGVYGAPETFLIGPDGTILAKHLGPMTPYYWETKFQPFLDDGRGAD